MTYVLDIAIVEQLHEEQDIAEELAFSVLHNFFDALRCTMQLVLSRLTVVERGRLAGQSQSLIQIWEVVGNYEHSIAQLEELSEPFELFG